MKAKVAMIIVAAGNGSRMNSSVKKQYMELEGRPVIYYSLKACETSAVIDEVIVVVSKEDIDYCRNEIIAKYNFTKVKAVTEGGAERYLSVWNGLKATGADVAYVMVHDAARPLISIETIACAYDRLIEVGACVVGVPVKDTIKQTDEDGVVVATPKRSELWTVQTPQCFKKDILDAAYNALWKDEHAPMLTDDAMIVEHYTSTKVHMVEGQYTNIKITTPEDIIIAKAFIRGGN
ncbi:MAG: 2-C-methyl-D-erythritol 4-phosphate cytidylyltransferase [Lachnospiraceae bacterium]|nr:2-C-methyl-D-erythritol 4-phosphate cytidylyltransferase [Lachnospiraceae bacterium]